jgi:ABC-type polysaccharide/polyol phosphate export permease
LLLASTLTTSFSNVARQRSLFTSSAKALYVASGLYLAVLFRSSISQGMALVTSQVVRKIVHEAQQPYSHIFLDAAEGLYTCGSAILSMQCLFWNQP